MQRNHGGELSLSSALSVFLIYRPADTKGRGRGAGRSGSHIRSLSHERRLLSLSLFEAAVRLSHSCIGKTYDPALPRRAVYYSSLPKHDSEGGGGPSRAAHYDPAALRADSSSQIFRRAIYKSLIEINRWGLGSILSTGGVRFLIGEVAEVYIKERGD